MHIIHITIDLKRNNKTNLQMHKMPNSIRECCCAYLWGPLITVY